MALSTIALSWVLLSGLVPPPPEDDVDPVAHGAALLAEAKAAMGGAAWDRIEVWHDAGTQVYADHTEDFEDFADYRRPRFTSLFHNGKTETKYVFDGRTSWSWTDGQLDEERSNPADGFGSRRAAYLEHNGYFFPDRFHASMVYIGRRWDQGRAYDVVHVLPDYATGADVWIDAQTHYIAGLAYEEGMPRKTAFADYRQVNGVITPFEYRDEDVTSHMNRIVMEPANEALFTTPKP